MKGYPGPESSAANQHHSPYPTPNYRLVTTEVSHTYSDGRGSHDDRQPGPNVLYWRSIPYMERMVSGNEFSETYPLTALTDAAHQFDGIASGDKKIALIIGTEQVLSILDEVRLRATKFVAEERRRITRIP